MPTYERADLKREGLTAPRCSARSQRTGKQCGAYAIRGGTVCRVHGGAAPAVKAAARRRLDQAADVLVQRLLGMALDGNAPDHVALAAIRDALDRAGMGAKQAVEVEHSVKPYEDILGNLTGVAQMSRAESRAARGVPDPVPALPASDDGLIDAEVVPDPAPERPDYGAVRPGDAQTPGPAPQRPGRGLMTLEQAAEEMAADRARWSGTRRIRSRRG